MFDGPAPLSMEVFVMPIIIATNLRLVVALRLVDLSTSKRNTLISPLFFVDTLYVQLLQLLLHSVIPYPG
jgi:hypothetical protein